jgi:putative hemolysin
LTGLALVAAVSSLLLAGWLRAAGTAISRIPRADALRAASEGTPGAAGVVGLLEEREAIAPSVGIVSSALLVLAAVIGMAVFGSASSLGKALLSAVVVGAVVFLGGDLLPRQAGRRVPTAIAYRSGALVAAAVRFGGWANELIPEPLEDETVSEELAGEDEADTQERELIHSVLEFGETIVREVMTPRPDMVTVPATASLEDLVATASGEGYSRVPVMSNADVVGLVIVKELLPFLSEGPRPSVAEVMRPVEFVPESMLASALLAEMQATRVHQMIVVDEYGDVAGLVTIEDLLEELVGEIADETDEEEDFVVSRGDGTWDVDARLPVEDLADLAGVDLPDEDWDTVGGLVLALAERVPEEGETFTYQGITLEVTRMQGRRVSGVSVSVERAVEAR